MHHILTTGTSAEERAAWLPVSRALSLRQQEEEEEEEREGQRRLLNQLIAQLQAVNEKVAAVEAAVVVNRGSDDKR